MQLQKINIQKINDFGGIKKLTIELCNLSLIVKNEDREYVDNCIVYFRSLYCNKVNMTNDIIQYKDLCFKTISVLERNNKTLKSKAFSFLIELISHNINYVNNIRKIA